MALISKEAKHGDMILCLAKNRLENSEALTVIDSLCKGTDFAHHMLTMAHVCIYTSSFRNSAISRDDSDELFFNMLCVIFPRFEHRGLAAFSTIFMEETLNHIHRKEQSNDKD